MNKIEVGKETKKIKMTTEKKNWTKITNEPKNPIELTLEKKN